MKKYSIKRNKSDIKSFAIRASSMIVILYLLFGIIFGVTTMKNSDMHPQIHAGDLILYYRLDKNYVANDVIVAKVGDEQLIGRVIAKPGDEVDITKEGKVVINGSLVVENDIFYPTPQYDSEITYPVLLKED